jgi:sugar phosphate isomerase/epimerase
VYPPFAEALAAGEPGFDLELQSFGLQGVRSARDWEERADFYIELARRHPQRTFHLHGPFLDLSYTSPDHLIQEATRRRIADTFELCHAIRPDHLIVHLRCPAYFCRPDRMAPWVQAAGEFWKPWLERFAGLGVTVAFENEQEPHPGSAIALLDGLKGYPCGFCLDVGHAHAFTDLPPRQWVQRLAGRIVHLHIHDNPGDDDRHLPPGEGTIDFPDLYAAIRRHCPQAVLSLELETGGERLLSSLAWSRSLLGRTGGGPGG